MISHYQKRCNELNTFPRRLLLSFAPVSSGKNIEFLKSQKYNFIRFTGNITKKRDVFNWIKKKDLDFLFHLAAIVPTFKVENNYKFALKVNYNGTKNIVDALNNFKKSKIKWFFFSYSSHVYGFSKNKINCSKIQTNYEESLYQFFFLCNSLLIH